jgi:hypothetical protein
VSDAEDLLQEAGSDKHGEIAELCLEDEEEVFASDGDTISYEDSGCNLNLSDGLTVNQRFEEQPRSYFEDKVKL